MAPDCGCGRVPTPTPTGPLTTHAAPLTTRASLPAVHPALPAVHPALPAVHPAAPFRSRTGQKLGRAALSGLALALLPKCPLCLAAYLSVLGVSAGVAVPMAALLHPAILLAAVVGLGLAAIQLASRRAAASLGA
jgi:hypothetical protein